MTAADLPDDLVALEQELGRRPRQEPPAGLRLRVLDQVRRTRTRERRLLLAAAAAVVTVVAALLLRGPANVRRVRSESAGLVQEEARALEDLGLDAIDARRLVLVAHAVELAPLAPPMGSGLAVPAVDGGG